MSIATGKKARKEFFGKNGGDRKKLKSVLSHSNYKTRKAKQPKKRMVR